MNTLKSGPPQQAAGPLAWAENDYVIRVLSHPSDVPDDQWQALLSAEQAQDRNPWPFATPGYWAALHDSGSAAPATGWHLQLLTLWRDPSHVHAAQFTPDTPDAPDSTMAATYLPPEGAALCGACACYIKVHSYGEYVFDWAWAEAHERHGLPYYPKGVVAVPFTPVPGPRLLAVDARARAALMAGVLAWAQAQHLSSLHLLFAQEADIAAARHAGLMLRHTVQFHWRNADATPEQRPFASFDAFLASLTQEKRKKIRQERRKVADAGVTFEARHGSDIRPQDWDFFYACYSRTYLEHRNTPYLSRDFFHQLAAEQPGHWVLFVAHRTDGEPIACSLIALSSISTSAEAQKDSKNIPRVAHGRYWGALERVDCLHFEACYYQPIAWCIAHGIDRFEGGAQGEHKMARALLPVATTSAHWLAHPAFADAVDRYLEREGHGINAYLGELQARSPLRQAPALPPTEAGGASCA